MASRLEFNFSQTFSGIVWNMLAVPGTDLLAIEIRDENKRTASFSVLDFKTNKFVCRNKTFTEDWWIGLTMATPDVLLFHIYLNPDNPDEKALMAFDFHNDNILWRLDHFSLHGLAGNRIVGSFTGETPAIATVDVRTGVVVDQEIIPSAQYFTENIKLQKPFQYIDGNVHFETVKSFLTSRLNAVPVGGVEYLEYEHLILVSYQTQHESLANFLVVFSEQGELLFEEQLGDHLKGLGLDTFFILSGFLFFVRNKIELISYRIV